MLGLVSGIIVYNAVLEKSHTEIDAYTLALEDAILEKNTKEADRNLTKIEEKWGKTRNMMMVFLNHSDLVNIEEKIGNMRSALTFSDFFEMYKECSSFKTFFKYAVSGANPSLINIL